MGGARQQGVGEILSNGLLYFTGSHLKMADDLYQTLHEDAREIRLMTLRARSQKTKSKQYSPQLQLSASNTKLFPMYGVIRKG